MKSILTRAIGKPSTFLALGCLLLAGCSQAIDTRPTVAEPAFGLSFTGTVVSIAPAKSDFPPEGIYQEFASALGRETRRLPGTDGFDARTDVFAAGAAALTTDAERLLGSTRCVYFFQIDNKPVENVILDILLLREVDPEFVDRDAFRDVPRIFSLPQSCNPEIKPGNPALFSYASGIGTIHPLQTGLQSADAAASALENSAEAGFRPSN